MSASSTSQGPDVLRGVLLPDDDAAEAVSLGTDGTDLCQMPQGAGRQEPGADPWVDLADLQGFVERRPPDLLLRVVAEAHGELVVEVEQVRRLGETDGDGVGQEIRRVLVGYAARAQLVD